MMNVGRRSKVESAAAFRRCRMCDMHGYIHTVCTHPRMYGTCMYVCMYADRNHVQFITISYI